ncbi:lysine--tRNA ligase [Ureaplasma canigenitalium]|uniref:lysine--tRNA ligase n=1 Tax=Ureaplasma canigenitalium TaxID=42092 RepID=UPI0004E1A2C0|nr:lysine--tRNA ligase [Ureaplasma canigenitalium]
MNRKFTEQEIIRRNTLEKLFSNNEDPYLTSKIARSSDLKTFKEQYINFSKDELHDMNIKPVTLAGRLMNVRQTFGVIQDFSGTLQIYLNKKNVTPELFQLFKSLDLGDIIEAQGTPMKTNSDELTLNISSLKLISKSLKVLPEKYHGLVDEELRARHRYVDLIVNPNSKQTFILRSLIIREIRNYLDQLGYFEVETPVLNDILSGAAARPFITHHNTLDKNYYLRIATEIPLKKCIVGGFEKVYEIGRIFRNEGMDSTHNPEFTSIELYAAYEDMWYVMDLTEKLIRHIAAKFNINKPTFRGHEIDLLKPFHKAHMVDLIKEHTGINFFNITDVKEAMQLAKTNNIKVEKHQESTGHIINLFFEHFVEDKIIQPTFVYGHPVEVSPLAKRNKDDDRFTDRFELFIAQKEFANAFSELNNPIDQYNRFLDQLNEARLGNNEANEMDINFIEALEYGMPPTAGLGIGIDRLVMLFTSNDTIRNVLLFPHMKDR